MVAGGIQLKSGMQDGGEAENVASWEEAIYGIHIIFLIIYAVSTPDFVIFFNPVNRYFTPFYL